MLDPYIEGWKLREMACQGELRPREIAEFFLQRVADLNSRLGAFWLVTADRAMADAERLEKLTSAERAALPLYGVPYSLKDMTWTKDFPTTFGSKNFENFMAPADAEIALRLREAGGILLGKTTMPEFGGRPTTEGGLHPPARNPWNPDYTGGGSSGGAAVSVAAGMAPIAAGTDGGGSIRMPASCCGLVGLKPARGRITQAPMQGEAWHGLSSNCPIARTVRDVALMLDVMAGPVVGDPYWAPPPAHPFIRAIDRRPTQLKLAAIAASALAPVDPEVGGAFDSACEAFRAMGHSVEPLAMDPIVMLGESVSTVICAGVSSYGAADPEKIDPIVRKLYERGLKVSAADYVRAVRTLHNVSREIVQRLAPYDALLTPTLACTPTELGKMPSAPERYTEELMGWLIFTSPFNSTGQPAISLPNGFTSKGLPIGLQIVAGQNDEIGLLSIAAAFEEARPWQDKRPPLG
ncbi:MAG TPA: amidase [Candidatus Binataceae bacterium]|nr:amidase [Candidatus Binataceae bacterium]